MADTNIRSREGPPAGRPRRGIATMTFFHFPGRAVLWMLSQMQRAQAPLRKVPGLRFFRLLGSGGENGFSARPDWNTYAIFAVWEDEAAADRFLGPGTYLDRFRERADSVWTVSLEPTKAHGLWGGQMPFPHFSEYTGGPLAVITRATIKAKDVLRFWRYVPTVSADLDNHPGMLFSKGIGEYPWIMQATFSLWTNREAMIDYAYNSPLHRDVVRKTREWGWYKEEMFANFVPYRSQGDFLGENPLNAFLTTPP